MSPHRWLQVPDEVWEVLTEAAAVHEEAYSQRFAETIQDDHVLVGKLGEWCFAEVVGAPYDPFVLFDGGSDFLGADVKTTAAVPPVLSIRFSARKRPSAPFYALCFYDTDGRRVRYLGWATRGDALAADVRSFPNNSYAYRILGTRLRLGLPTGFLSEAA